MRKFILGIMMLFLTIFCGYAQDYGSYSLPHTTNEELLQQFVGNRVEVLKYKPRSYSLSFGRDEYIFEHNFKGEIGKIYTIDRFKVGISQIVFYLVDNDGNTIKAKVNIDGENNYKGMQSCKSFFLIDKFNNDMDSLKGKSIKNENKEEVATIEGGEMVPNEGSYPIINYIIKSKLNGETFTCSPNKVEEYCKKNGTKLVNPKVKNTYQIVGVKISLPETSYDKIKEEYYVKNSETGTVSTCLMSNPNDAFKEDLSGSYISILTKVEKPSNPSIRYGKTTTIEDDKKISKFSYIDNVIDITILGSSKEFDFVLKNISDNSIKVVWNEAVFVNYDGSTSKIMHYGTKYSQREGDQPATTIIKGAKIDDCAVPNGNVRYSETLKEWVTDSMYPTTPGRSPGTLQLMLPIQIKDVINEYIFVFDVKYVYKYPERLNILEL